MRSELIHCEAKPNTNQEKIKCWVMVKVFRARGCEDKRKMMWKASLKAFFYMESEAIRKQDLCTIPALPGTWAVATFTL